MSVKRIGLGLAAQGFSQAVTIALQLVATPMLLAAWGVADYGVWLIVGAVPAYLALADLGFSQVAGNDMSMKLANHDQNGAQEVFASLFALFLWFVAPLFVLIGAVVAWAPLDFISSFSGIDAASVRPTFLVLVAYGAVALFCNVVSAVLRAEGLFSAMVGLSTLSRLAEGLGVLVAARFFEAGLFGAALTLLGARFIAALAYVALMHARSQTFRLSVRKACYPEMRRLALPSLMFMAFPIGNALCLQGVLVIIGGYLSPTAVAAYSASRTLGRLGVNSLAMANHVFLYEYSTQASNPAGLRRVALMHATIEAVGLLPFILILIVYGRTIFDFWLHRQIEFDRSLLLVIVLQSVFEAVWAAFQTPLIALNAHKQVAMAYLLGALIAMFSIKVILANGGSLVAAAAVLLVLFFVLSVHATWRVYSTTWMLRRETALQHLRRTAR